MPAKISSKLQHIFISSHLHHPPPYTTMPLLRKTLAVTGWTSLGAALAFTISTRKSTIHPVPETDYLLSTTLFARYNPNPNPSMRDICLRRVPLDRIKPELLAHEGRLVEAFCGAVWSGWAFEVQRRYLARKYRGPETEGQLWDVGDLERSAYAVGTKITDHVCLWSGLRAR